MPAMRVLVTGGSGYIGSHTARALVQLGHRVVILDRVAPDSAGPLAGLPFLLADIADTTAVRRVLEDSAIDGVIHFAGSKSVAESMRDPGAYIRNNVGGSLSVLEAMVAAGTRRIVFSSSCSVYGDADRCPVDERAPLRPRSPYGASKMLVEELLGWFGRVHGIEAVSLRYFNAAGASGDARIGEDWDRSTMLIPMLMKAVLGHRGPVDLYGTDYPTPDGTAIRDYVHVEDLADAHVRALAAAVDPGAPLVLNLGTGRGASIREVVALIDRVAGQPVPVREVARRPGDPAAVWADASRASEVLGWTARFTLDEIVESAWRWHRSAAARARQAGEEAAA
jgi:UDP-glucose-4-epimerase GalE